jgi:hypothetical protein
MAHQMPRVVPWSGWATWRAMKSLNPSVMLDPGALVLKMSTLTLKGDHLPDKTKGAVSVL